MPNETAPASRGPRGPSSGQAAASVNVRDATVADLAELSALAYASKAHWGYDDAFMHRCRDELTVHAADLGRVAVRVAERNGEVVGFHGVAPCGPQVVELEWLFVAPAAMGSGHGRALLADAVSIAQLAGARTLRIASDPNALEFYLRAGAHQVGDEPSASIPGRALPLLELAVG
jgi:N-acetylglutamate synthase-like GNAT family acetyltransferase